MDGVKCSKTAAEGGMTGVAGGRLRQRGPSADRGFGVDPSFPWQCCLADTGEGETTESAVRMGAS